MSGLLERARAHGPVLVSVALSVISLGLALLALGISELDPLAAS